MATLHEVAAGLEILKKYVVGDGCVCAEHDILYAGGDMPVSDEDKKKLDELGWHYDESLESWARFV